MKKKWITLAAGILCLASAVFTNFYNQNLPILTVIAALVSLITIIHAFWGHRAKDVIATIIILSCATMVAFFVYKTEPKLNHNYQSQSIFYKKYPFRLGLDLSGGSHLVYKADVTALAGNQVDESMDALRDVIERRINLFGVSEPVVQVQHASFVSGGDEQLIVDLPGVTDVEKAAEMIGQTPLLEFKIENPNRDTTPPTQNIKVGKDGKIDLSSVNLNIPEPYIATDLTGRYLKRATLEFNPNTREPQVSLQFDETGTKLFADITRANLNKTVAIYLDGEPISAPNVNDVIPNGQAVISGTFTPQEAKTLVGRLNSGALPVPITLISTQTIGATLGDRALMAGVKAAVIGFILVALFLLVWYRLPGLVATLSMAIFVVIILALFKLMPVTLTAAGIAGFIISIGIAVDANVLIFERVKEELNAGHSVSDAVTHGFSRAWLAIRDSNISNLLTALILFWFGTPLIKGFALTLGMGVIVSLLSAIIITRIFLKSLNFVGNGKVARFLFSSGISK